MVWDLYKPHADRMTPVAVIPMTTPEEAIDELEYAVGKLGMKAITVEGVIRRTVPKIRREAPQYANYATWLDTLGQDSEYDYDPVWKKMVELKVAPTCHSASARSPASAASCQRSSGASSRASPSYSPAAIAGSAPSANRIARSNCAAASRCEPRPGGIALASVRLPAGCVILL